jgi:hypothetical protein
VQAVIAIVLVMNGFFLSFKVSPFLLQREREGHSAEPLPLEWQKKISIAFILSFAGWWGALLLTVYQLLTRS